jgi:hypothetical protein
VDVTVENGGPSEEPLDEAFAMTIPFVFGQPVTIDASFRLGVGLRGAHLGAERWSGIADGTHAGSFGPATVLDANGDAVAGAAIVSDSGYDYATPEPGRPALEALALGLLGLQGRSAQGRSRRTSGPGR